MLACCSSQPVACTPQPRDRSPPAARRLLHKPHRLCSQHCRSHSCTPARARASAAAPAEDQADEMLARMARDRANSAIAPMDEPDEEYDSSTEDLILAAPQAVKPPAPAHTPFYNRITNHMAWGTTTKEEKRSLWSDKGKLSLRRKRVQRQAHIGVPTDLLLTALRKRLAAAGDPTSDENIDELSAMLRLQLRHELFESSLWLVDAFDVLSSDSSTVATPTAPSDGYADSVLASPNTGASAAHEALSDRFIDGLCALMQRASFRLFSQREWQFAQSENFMFTLPTCVSWSRSSGLTLVAPMPLSCLPCWLTQLSADRDRAPQGCGVGGARFCQHFPPLRAPPAPRAAGGAARAARARLPPRRGRRPDDILLL